MFYTYVLNFQLFSSSLLLMQPCLKFCIICSGKVGKIVPLGIRESQINFMLQTRKRGFSNEASVSKKPRQNGSQNGAFSVSRGFLIM